MTRPDRKRWHAAGRDYVLTHLVAADDYTSLELEDVGPPPGRGQVLEISRDDDTGTMTVLMTGEEPLPLELVERLAGEARRVLAWNGPARGAADRLPGTGDAPDR